MTYTELKPRCYLSTDIKTSRIHLSWGKMTTTLPLCTYSLLLFLFHYQVHLFTQIIIAFVILDCVSSQCLSSHGNRVWDRVEDLQRMSSLARSSHLQLAAFALGTVGWILCTISMGIVEWRVWHVDNTTIISSGIAWVGIWKVCFISYLHVSPGYKEQFCHKFSGYDSSIPHEIYAAQGLLLIAMFMGLLGVTATIFALRNVYMGVTRKTLITHFFLAGGCFYILAGLCVLIPVSWNFYSVTHNQSIAFPPSYYMPSSPAAQEAGAAIPIGIVAVILLLLSGTFSLSYRFPATANTITKS